MRLGNNQEEIYVISLIEHKSQVDADVAMQLLLYMTVIWKDYARKCNKQKKNANKSSHFRYPLIIPIVYYEGTDKWTAGLRLSDRIAHAELAMDYVPDFTYKIIPLREYGNNELKLHNNEMSLIMMINKIQSAVDLHEFRLTALDFLKDIYGSTSTDIQKLILDVIWGLLMKIDVPEEKAEKMLQCVRKGNDMGVLFENFKTFDWKEANEKREAAEAELRTTERKLDETKALLKTAESKLETAESKLETAESKLETAEVRLTQEKNRADQAVIKAERLERELKRLQDRQQ